MSTAKNEESKNLIQPAKVQIFTDYPQIQPIVKKERHKLKKWKRSIFRSGLRMISVTTIAEISRLVREGQITSTGENINFKFGEFPICPSEPIEWFNRDIRITATLPASAEQYFFEEWKTRELENKLPFLHCLFFSENNARIFLDVPTGCTGTILLSHEPYQLIFVGQWDQALKKLQSLEAEMLNKFNSICAKENV